MPLTQVIGTEPLKEQEETEINDGDFELIRKIRSIAGLGYDALHGEHAYTRQKGNNDLSVPLPTRKLFYSYETESFSPERDEDVDIDSIIEEEPLVDTAVANRLLDECEKLIEIYRPRADKRDTEDCWDEIIPKHNWSASHLTAFNQLLRILNLDRLSRLSHTGHSSEAILRRVTIEQTATRLRHLLGSNLGWNVKQAQWLHGVLVNWAPVKTLVSYLEAMQVLHAKIPALVNQVINASQVSLASKNLGLDIITQIVTKKCWDPVAPMLAQHKMPKLPLTPVFIVLGSEPLHDLPQNSRTHHWIRLLTELGTVIPITSLQTDQDKSRMKIATYLDELLYTVRYRIHAAKSEFSDPAKRPLILVGLNAGSALMAHAALYETASVGGVICVGFSVDTAEGKRGREGDRILDLRCPTLFVIGGSATTSSERDVDELRGRMQCISGLIVVGGADDQLRKNKLDLMRERVTQDVVDRAVVNEVAAFLSKAFTMPKPSPPPKPTPVAPDVDAKPPKEPKLSKRETKEKEKATKKNYYMEKKRKLAEMLANGSVESSPKKQKREVPVSGKNPQIIMVSTAPTILRTSTASGKQHTKIKKSDVSPRKILDDHLSAQTLTSPTSSVPQITIVSKTVPAGPSKLHLTSSASNVPVTSSSLSRALHKVIPKPTVKLPSSTSIIPSSTSILPSSKSILSSRTSIRIPASTSIHPVSSVKNVPASPSILPVTKTGPATATPASSTSTSSVPSVSSSESSSIGGVLSLQSLLKSHQSVKPVPLSQTKKKSNVVTTAQTTPTSAGVGTSRNIRVVDNRSRTFNISSLSNVRYLTTSPLTPITTTQSSSQSNLLRDLTPAQLLDAPIDIMDAPVDDLITDVTEIDDVVDDVQEVLPVTRGMPIVNRPSLGSGVFARSTTGSTIVNRSSAGSSLTPVVSRTPGIPGSSPRQSVKLIRINKAGINITSRSPTSKEITRIFGPTVPKK